MPALPMHMPVADTDSSPRVCPAAATGDDDHADKPALEVCYLRHAFGLGEHYNSTKKLLFGAGAAGVDEDEDEEDVQEEEQLEAEAGSS